MLILPLVIFVNLYQYIVVTTGTNMGTFEYKGLHYFYEYVSTFNGLTHTLDTFNNLKNDVASYIASTMEITDLVTFFTAFGNFFKMVWTVLQVPIWIITDIVTDVFWFLEMFMSF